MIENLRAEMTGSHSNVCPMTYKLKTKIRTTSNIRTTMLLKIIYEKSTEKIEILSHCHIKDLKKEIIKRLAIDEMMFESHSNFIYKNFILNEDHILKFYHVVSGDEIFVGKIENYLNNLEIRDQTILEVFIGRLISELIFLIVNVQDTLSNITLILKTIFTDLIVVDTWNMNGEKIGMDKCVYEIDRVNEYPKIILNELNHTFDECRKIHDQFFLEKYSDNYQDDFLRFENCFFMIPEKRNISEDFLNYVMGPDSFNHKELDKKMSDVMKCVQNSKFLFSLRMADRIFYLLKKIWISLKLDFEKKFLKNSIANPFDIHRIFDRFDDYFRVALLMSVMNFHRTRNGTGANKSIRNIVEDAAEYMTNNRTNWNTLVKNYLGEFISKTFDFQKALKTVFNYPSIEWQTTDDNFDIINLPKHIFTVGNLKKEISRQLGENKDNLRLIKDGETQSDDDYVIDLNDSNGCRIIIMLSMDNIEVLEELGNGAFAKVKLCKNNTLKSSPSMILFHGIYLHSNKLCIAMEYISGKTLESVLKDENSLDYSLKLQFVFQILQQIKSLHDAGIIHRDISCNNIMIYKENQNAKLIDFGLSISVKGLNTDAIELSGKYGTPWYMAPELLTHEPYSNKIDIWSVGVVAVKIFSGKRPYTNLNPTKFQAKIAKDKTIELDPQKFSKDVFDFLSPCFKSDPKERPTVDDLLSSKMFQINRSWQISRISRTD